MTLWRFRSKPKFSFPGQPRPQGKYAPGPPQRPKKDVPSEKRATLQSPDCCRYIILVLRCKFDPSQIHIAIRQHEQTLVNIVHAHMRSLLVRNPMTGDDAGPD